MMLQDKYSSLDHLKLKELKGVDFTQEVTRRDSGVLVISPHGGNIELYTSEIASGIANADCKAFMHFDFRGTKDSGNLDLHVSSIRYEDDHLTEMLQFAQVVCSVHGCKGNDLGIYLGGLDKELIQTTKENLERHFDFLKNPQSHLRGVHKKNICNRGINKKGLQLELTLGFRKYLMQNPEQMFLFCSAVSKALLERCHSN